MPAWFGPPVQLAYLVDDPAAAARDWERRFGAGPFTVREHIGVTDVLIHGEPGAFDHSSAYGWWGSIMIELLCQHGDDRGVVTEWRERRTAGAAATGLHHIACFVDDLDIALEGAGRAGLTTTMTATAGTTRFAFVDDLDRHGHFWELYEPNEHLAAFYDFVERQHRAGARRT